MKTKLCLSCAGALLLAYAVVRFSARREPPTASKDKVAAHGPVAGAQGATANSAANSGRFPHRPGVPTSDVPRPEASPDEVEQFLIDLLGLLGRGGPEQRQAQIAQFVDGQDVAVLRDLLGDEKSVLAVPEDVSQAILKRLARADAPWTGDYLQAMPASTFRHELLGTVMAQ